jgi:ribosomal subunit interface protein
MHKRITFKNMDHSDVMEDYINQQLAKIEHILENEPTPIYIDMVLEASKTREHPRAELRVKSPHFDCISNYEKTGVDMYDIIDRVIDIMYHQLREQKKKACDDRKQCGRHDEFKKQR